MALTIVLVRVFLPAFHALGFVALLVPPRLLAWTLKNCSDQGAERGKNMYGPSGMLGAYHVSALFIYGGILFWHCGAN